MRAKHVKQVIAGCFSLGLLGVSAVLAAAPVCTSDTSGGAIFGVLPGGTIQTNVNNKECKVEFYGASSLGGSYTGPSDGCKVHDSDGKATGPLVTGGSTQAPRVLTEFSESPEADTIVVAKTEITTAVRKYEAKDVDSNSEIEIDTGTRKLKVKVVGEMNGSHYYIFPGGDYGTIKLQNVLENGFEWVKFSAPIRARNLIDGACNPVNHGWYFSEDDESATPYYRRQNYINQFNSGGKMGSGCGIKVPGAKTTINILGKERVSDSAVTGFDFGQAGGCYNFTDKACAKNINDIKPFDMESQIPAWLQINVYNGGVTFSDRIYFAGGLYVPNGTVETTSASGTVLAGQILAASIKFNQGNSGTKFYSGNTNSTSLQNKYYSLTPPISDRVLKTGDYIYRATQRDFRSDGVTKGTSGHLMAFAMKADSSHDEVPVWDAADPALMVDRAGRIKTEDGGWATSASDFKTLDSTYSCVIDPRAADCRKSNDPRDPESLVGVPWRTAPIIAGKSVLFATDDGILYSINKSNGKLNWGWIPSQILARTTEDNARMLMSTKHSWGQIGTQTVVSTDGTSRKLYVMGSALGGQLHFSIEVSDDGDVLKNVAWIDYQADSYSPGALTKNFDGTSDNSWPGREGRPHGGAAPVASFVDGAISAAYITGDKLFVRSVDGSVSAPVGKSLVMAGAVAVGSGASAAIIPSSNLLYMNDNQIYFGAANGTVYQTDIDGRISDVEDGINKLTLGTDPVWHVNGSRLVSGSGSALMLTAQTKRRVNVLKYAADKWSLAWWTGLSATGEKESSSATAEQIPVTAADDAQITAPASIRNGQIILYYTKGVSGCSPEAYSFGPLYLEDGRSALSGAQFRFKDATSLSNYLGVGQATGGNDVIVNGKDGVLAGSSGTTMESGNTGILTNSGANNRKRLNWRELTNFF